MRIWCISDTHGKHGQLELINPDQIDMIIHCGDASNYRDIARNKVEMEEFLDWFSNLPYKYKLYIPGNHDTSVERKEIEFPEGITVVNHETVEIEGIKFFGSPITPEFGGWSFNVPDANIERKWAEIPEDTDVLITHGPCKWYLDVYWDFHGRQHIGCEKLLNRVKTIKPSAHIFGHVHNDAGIENAGTFRPSTMNTTFVNASVVNNELYVVNNGVVINYCK